MHLRSVAEVEPDRLLTQNVVLSVNTSAAASRPVYFSMTGAAATAVTSLVLTSWTGSGCDVGGDASMARSCG